MTQCSVLIMAVASAMLVRCPAAVPADDPPPAETISTGAAPAATGKERLSDKASDEQRVDNCKVPPERRGTKARPSTCPDARQVVPTN